MFQIYSFFGVLFFLIQKDKVPPLYFLLPCVATTQKHEGKKAALLNTKQTSICIWQFPLHKARPVWDFRGKGDLSGRQELRAALTCSGTLASVSRMTALFYTEV